MGDSDNINQTFLIFTLNTASFDIMSDEDDSFLRYDKMVEHALRGVVKQAIEEVMRDGLPGDHHFYITFMTDYPGVDIPKYLTERYPGEMTIVLQFQFDKLDVDDHRMVVELSFNNVPERLEIPLAAITIFADPSVNFALQFQPLDDTADNDFDPDDTPDDDGGAPSDKDDSGTGEVVSLDQFRKK